MLHVAAQATAAADAIRQRWNKTPRAGIVLGSGLGDLAHEIDAEATFDYAELPHFPRTTAIGQAVRLRSVVATAPASMPDHAPSP